jgi:hypothetical protein
VLAIEVEPAKARDFRGQKTSWMAFPIEMLRAPKKSKLNLEFISVEIAVEHSSWSPGGDWKKEAALHS